MYFASLHLPQLRYRLSFQVPSRFFEEYLSWPQKAWKDHKLLVWYASSHLCQIFVQFEIDRQDFNRQTDFGDVWNQMLESSIDCNELHSQDKMYPHNKC